MHRWTATELAGRAAREPGPRLAGAHRQAAAYWQWRVRVWPQDKAADVHDLLEARHHLLQAGDIEERRPGHRVGLRPAAHLGRLGPGSFADP